MVGSLFYWWVGWLVCCLVGWLIARMIWLLVKLNGLLLGWLTYCLDDLITNQTNLITSQASFSLLSRERSSHSVFVGIEIGNDFGERKSGHEEILHALRTLRQNQPGPTGQQWYGLFQGRWNGGEGLRHRRNYSHFTKTLRQDQSFLDATAHLSVRPSVRPSVPC